MIPLLRKLARIGLLALMVALMLAFALSKVAHAQSAQVQQANDDALGQLIIQNGTGDDAEVKVVDNSTSKLVYDVHVPSSPQDYTITGIPDGTYTLAFWIGTSTNGYGKKFTDPLLYTTTATDQGTQYTIYTVTLQPVPNGNAPTTGISSGEFNNM